MSIDPNLVVSLALAYTGGIRAPVPGQAGYTALVDSAGTNLEYVARSTVLGSCAVKAVGTIAVALTKDAYAEITGGTFSHIVEDPVLIPSATAASVVCNTTAAARLRVDVSLGLVSASGAIQIAAKLYVNGVDSGAVYPITTADASVMRRIAFSTLIPVAAGATVDVRITNLTDNTDVTLWDFCARYELCTAP